MKESLLKRLFESRLMTTDEEFETFDSTLDAVSYTHLTLPTIA